MTRPLRIEYPGAVYHITSRGIAWRDIFLHDDDRLAFLELLAKVTDRFSWLCHAYCLMSNHYHLVVETADANLACGMRYLNSVYTQLFNRRHKTSGRILQGRYKAILVEKETHLLSVACYVVLNPVRANKVTDCCNWPWSSYRATAGIDPPPAFLTTDCILSKFSVRSRKVHQAYRRFVLHSRGEAIWENLRGQVFLGSEEFIREHVPEESRLLVEVPREQRLVARPHLEAIFASQREDIAIAVAHNQHGYRLKEIADYLGVHYSTISRRLHRLDR